MPTSIYAMNTPCSNAHVCLRYKYIVFTCRSLSVHGLNTSRCHPCAVSNKTSIAFFVALSWTESHEVCQPLTFACRCVTKERGTQRKTQKKWGWGGKNKTVASRIIMIQNQKQHTHKYMERES